MLNKTLKTRYGIDGNFWAPIEVLVEPHGSRVNVGVWASKASYEAGNDMLEKRTFFFGGGDNPFKLTDAAVRTKIKNALKTLAELQDATDTD